MIEIDGVELRTAAQWEKKHRHVKKGQLGKGVERTWRSPNGNTTAMFYNIEQTRPWAKKDVEAVNRRRRADAKAKREAEERERIESAARAEQHRKDLLDCWGAHIDEETLQEGRRDHTAYQWCDLGFATILLAICLSSFFIERWTSLSISIRQAKAFLQLVERHGLKPACPVIFDLLQ